MKRRRGRVADDSFTDLTAGEAITAALNATKDPMCAARRKAAPEPPAGSVGAVELHGEPPPHGEPERGH